MTSSYGALQIPAQLPDDLGIGKDRPVDRVLDCLGNYLCATLNDRLNAMWSAVAPGLAPVVRRVFTAQPKDVLLNESNLPALFLWRGRGAASQIADDIRVMDTPISVLWLLDPGSVIQREKRLRMLSVVAANIDAAVNECRDPSWFDSGDPEPTAAALGSSLIDRAGLVRPPFVTFGEEIPITITPETGEAVTYHAINTVVMVSEYYSRDPAAGTSLASGAGGGPSKVDITGTTGALQLESTIPTT